MGPTHPSFPFRLLTPLLSVAACTLAAQSGPLQVTPPSAPGGMIRFVFQAPPGTAWATVFYRAAGEEEFRSKALAPGEAGLVADLPPGELGGSTLQYYLAFRDATEVKYLPEGAPTQLGSLEVGTSSAPTSAAIVPSPHSAPFRVEGSLEQTFYRSQKQPGEQTFFSSGQVAVGYHYESGEHKLALDTRLSYQENPPLGQNRWTVAELRGSYAYREHRLQTGDMVVQESEFTVGGAGRRGSDYTYDDRKLYAHVFAVNSQQMAGFRGVAWPVKGTELFGGALGYTWLEGKLKAKLVLLTGKDDPAASVNAGFAGTMHPREGSTGALVMESVLFENRLSLAGEYARASYDRNLSDEVGTIQDQAWRLQGGWTDPRYSLRASYRQIGRDFGSLGLPVMEGDRRGAEAGASVNLGSQWALNATVTSERNNPNANPLETRSRNDARSADVRWTARPTLTLKAGLTQGEQEAGNPLNAEIPFSNSRRAGAFTGFDWMPSPAGSVAFNLQFDRLESTGVSKATGHSTTLTLGGTYQKPDALRLAPSFSWAKSTDDLTGAATTVGNLFLNADVTLMPKVLILALNGTWNRTETPGFSPGPDPAPRQVLTSTSADAALQYFLDSHLERRFGKGRAVLALRFKYLKRQDLPASDRRASLTLNFSF